MQTILCFPTGRREPGIVLSLERDSMRVAVRFQSDVLELRSIGGQWISDRGALLHVEGLLAGW